MGYYFCRTSFPSFKKCWRRTWPPDFFRTVKHERGEPSRRFVLTYTQQDPWYFIFLLFFVYKPSILRSPPSVQFHTTLYSSRWHYVARRRRQQKCTIFNRWARFFFLFPSCSKMGGGGDNICSTGLYGEHNLASRTYRFYDRDLNDKVKASAGRNFKIKIYITRTYNPFDWLNSFM